ncbi:hypothetical protein MASSI9I_10262 [Massilia sp. 9I]|nr:hypothetical protein MASSI9I_10262 [Massilia sp. 9I]
MASTASPSSLPSTKPASNTPSSMFFSTAPDVACTSEMATCGAASRMWRKKAGRRRKAGSLTVPITSSPAISPFRVLASSRIASTACRARLACSNTASPALVSVMPRAWRSNRRTRSSSSNPLMWALIAGWLRCSSSAARATVPQRAMVTNDLSWWISMALPSVDCRAEDSTQAARIFPAGPLSNPEPQAGKVIGPATGGFVQWRSSTSILCVHA